MGEPPTTAVIRDLPYQEMLSHAEEHGIVLHREDIYASGPPVDVLSEEIFDYVLAHVGETVLDVGCGLGPYVARLNQAGRRCVGVDADPAIVEAATALGRPVEHMSAARLAYPDDAFDSVILVETLEHLQDYEQALSEAARVARRSIVVTVPDISVLPLMSTRGIVPWHLLEATHVNFFTPEILRRALLRYVRSCDVARLGHFMDIDGRALHVHAVATAYP